MEPYSSSTIAYHYFDTSVQNIWTIINDVTRAYHLLHQTKTHFHSEPIFHVNNNSQELGSIFSFVFLSTHLIYFKVEKHIETDYWCHYQWKAYLTNYSPLFLIQFSVYYINETKCLLTLEFTQYIKYKFYFDQIIQKFKLFNSLENIFRTNGQFKLNIDSIGIKCPFSLVSNMLLDWKTYQSNVPILCDEINYEGRFLQKGTVLTMKFKMMNGKEETCTVNTLKVGSIVVLDNYFSLNFVTVDQAKGVPFQEIEYTVWKVNDEQSYFIIKHRFQEVVPQRVLMFYSKIKEKLMKKTKCWFENLCFVLH